MLALRKRNELVVQLFKSGTGGAEIAALSGVSRPRVYQILKAAGVSAADGGVAIKHAAAHKRIAADEAARVGRRQAKFGVSLELLADLRSTGVALLFQRHKSSAARRGIGFELTLGEWLSIWQESGFFSLRGRGRGRYCMSRIGDVGPYAVGNVFIQSCEQNTSEYRQRFLAGGGTATAKSTLGSGRGWTLLKDKRRGKPYCVQVAGTKATYHATQNEAETEYARRCALVAAERGISLSVRHE